MAETSAPNLSPLDRLKAAAAGVELPNAGFVVPKAAPVADVQESWSLVVAGAIDYRIHVPAWYKQIELLSDKELHAAQQSLVSVITPGMNGFNEFRFGEFIMSTAQDRWTFQTTNPDSRQKLIDFAETVFDKKLNDLPIIAYGNNRLMKVKIKGMKSREFLSGKIRNSLCFRLAMQSLKSNTE